jgi:vancomycin resistance protein YoaR
VLAIVGGAALLLLFFLAIIVGFDSVYAGQIYPGISVAGLDLSRMAPDEAATRLAEHIRYAESGKIVFRDGEKVWIARPADVGLFLDPENSAMAAYNRGRQGNPVYRVLSQFEAWYFGVDLPPQFVYDERIARSYLESIAALVNKPAMEASLSVNGVDVSVQPGQVGRTLDVAATLAPLEAQLRSLSDGILPLEIVESPPAILDVSEQAEIARKILSAPLTLHLPEAQEGDPGPWTFEPQNLAGMLTIQRVESPQGALYQVGLNAEGLRSFLKDQASGLARTASNARFIFNDETRQLEVIQPAVIGRALDVDATIETINRELAQGQHDIDLAVEFTPPAVADDATAEQLGITELVSEQTTFFYGSSAARLQNIETAASRFHGVLVAPGETFSMAQVMGDVSLDNGYAEALIIFGNRTIQGVGGGVCQVSTTLFRTVFFGGFPVVERYPHAYRVSYYELNAANQIDSSMAGLDATVFVPVVDFKFTNDTPNWLLMETYTNARGRSLTWKFYSTSDGRSVTWDTSGLRNIVEPPEPLYQENDELAKGETRQVDWAVEGADVDVVRTVSRDGQVLYQDEFRTHYLPWRAVIEYGPGTKVPKNKESE